MNQKYYIGLASTFHDPAMAIVNSKGEVVFAEAAERYLQNKRALNYAPDDLVRLPRLICEYCGDSELVLAFSWPRSYGRRVKFMSRALRFLGRVLSKTNEEAILGNEGYAWPVGSAAANFEWMAESIKRTGMNLRTSPYITGKRSQKYFDHHLSHAATACYSSPFEEATCAIVDGYGVGGACNFYEYSAGNFKRIENGGKWDDGSLGHFYSVVCALCDFDPIVGEEWKVMGLAPYGKVDKSLYEEFASCVYVEDLRIHFRKKQKHYLMWLEGLRKTCSELRKTPEGHAAIACTGQAFFEDRMNELLKNLAARGFSKNLVLSGGCALNSTYNGQIIKRTSFQKLFVTSAPGDDGCALGAAMLAFKEDHPDYIPEARAQSPYLGSSINPVSLGHCVEFSGPQKVKHLDKDLSQKVAKILADGGIIGWMQGRAEFGPRALGNRSILADPRPLTMKDAINRRVKFREKFRPFAPAILHEFGDDYFEDYQESPYMERTLRFKESVRSKIPAVVHENGSGRLQSVKREWHPKYYDLIQAFYELTGVPVLLNTSFNVMGKPIVHSVEDAFGVFYSSGLDALVIEDYLFTK